MGALDQCGWWRFLATNHSPTPAKSIKKEREAENLFSSGVHQSKGSSTQIFTVNAGNCLSKLIMATRHSMVRFTAFLLLLSLAYCTVKLNHSGSSDRLRFARSGDTIYRDWDKVAPPVLSHKCLEDSAKKHISFMEEFSNAELKDPVFIAH